MGAGCPITPSTKKDRSKLPQVRLRLLFSRLSVMLWVPARERLTQVARMCAFRVAGRPAGVWLPQSTCEGASTPPLPRSGSCFGRLVWGGYPCETMVRSVLLFCLSTMLGAQ
jgi:hypothetical protein